MAAEETSSPPALRRRGEAVAQYLVPVALGAFTWLLVLIAGGVLLSADSPSLGTVLVAVPLGLLFVPVYRFRPWEPGVTERVLAFPRRRRVQVTVATALFVLVRRPVVVDSVGPALRLLLLPMRVVPGLLFDVSLFYDARLGRPVGEVLFDAGRLYAEFLWLYAVGSVVAIPVPTGGGE